MVQPAAAASELPIRRLLPPLLELPLDPELPFDFGSSLVLEVRSHLVVDSLPYSRIRPRILALDELRGLAVPRLADESGCDPVGRSVAV